MPAAARLQLTGCALLTALLLGGCGSGDPDSTTAPTVTSGEGRFQDPGSQRNQKSGNDAEPAGKDGHVPAGDLCQSQLGSFVGSMDGLRRRLAVGVTYDQYVAEVRGIRSTYGEIPIGRLQVDCLSRVAGSSEMAFNRYIEGANEWGECVSEVGCGTTEIEPVLQRRWRIASRLLSEAQDGLRAIAR